MKEKALLMDANGIKRALARIAHEIIERNDGVDNVVLLGIKRGGEAICSLLSDYITLFEGTTVNKGSIDITFYRDDLTHLNEQPEVKAMEMGFDTLGKDVILVDDVLYTGRTARAAMEAVMNSGRPKSIQLAVLIDRGHRELPIRADFVGKNVPTSKNEVVSVNVVYSDSVGSVNLLSKE